MPKFNVVILAHRGEGCTNRNPNVYQKRLQPREEKGGQIMPENSLSAFDSAFASGADGFECDVFPSKDGEAMIIHDNQLARNVDSYHYWGPEQNEDILGNVSDYTAEELRQKFTIGNNEPIPTLEELIKLAIKHNEKYKAEHEGRNLTLNIELKAGREGAKAAYAVVKKFLDDPLCPFKKSDFLFNSFESACLYAMKEFDSELQCALGVTTKSLYQGLLMMPGWIPTVSNYSDEATHNLAEITDVFGLDLVTSDLQEDIIGPLCQEKKIPINLAINALRVRREAEEKGLASAHMTELEREKLEVRKLVAFSEKYGVKVYYKSDSPGLIKRYLAELELEENLEEMNKIPSKIKPGEQRVIRVLDEFAETIEAINSKKHNKAKESAEELYRTLNEHAQNYFKDHNKKIFIDNCRTSIEHALPQLNDLGWAKILQNLLIALWNAIVPVSYQSDFFKTKLAKKAEGIPKTLESLHRVNPESPSVC